MKEGSFREGRAQRRSGEEIPTRPIKNNSEINTVNAKTAAVGLGAQLSQTAKKQMSHTYVYMRESTYGVVMDINCSVRTRIGIQVVSQ